MRHAFARRLVAVSLVGAFTFLTGTAPGIAAERPEASPTPTLLASGTAQVQQLATATTGAPARAVQEGATSGYDDPGTFFRTKRGIALLVLAGAGIGYMWYSKVHDRIHSDARARLD